MQAAVTKIQNKKQRHRDGKHEGVKILVSMESKSF